MQARKSDIQNLDRLKQRSDFLRVQQTGRKWTARGLIVQVAPSSSSQIRAGFTVSKRLSASSVMRNRVRRRLKAVAADILPPCAAPGDYVLIGRPETAGRPYKDLQNDLKWCLEKLSCLKAQK